MYEAVSRWSRRSSRSELWKSDANRETALIDIHALDAESVHDEGKSGHSFGGGEYRGAGAEVDAEVISFAIDQGSTVDSTFGGGKKGAPYRACDLGCDHAYTIAYFRVVGGLGGFDGEHDLFGAARSKMSPERKKSGVNRSP